MLFKIISIVQAILLTGLFVHNVHLEGLLQDKAPTLFYRESVNKHPAQSVEVPLSVPSNHKSIAPTFELLPSIELREDAPDNERNNRVQELNDILGGQVNSNGNSNNDDGPSSALFGEANEKTLAKKKTKNKT